MKLNKKFIVATILSITVFSIFAMSAMGASEYVHLTYWEAYDYSAQIGTDSAYVEGNNSASSDRSVYLMLDYSYGSGWNCCDSSLMAPGEDDESHTYYSTNVLWRCQLNPYGGGTWGCDAEGWVYGS